MIPVRIRFSLASPIAFSGASVYRPIMFDGLLGAMWAREKGLVKTPTENMKSQLIFPELPLELINGRYYAASAMFLPEDAPTTMRMDGLVKPADWCDAFAHHIPSARNNFFRANTMWSRAAMEKFWLLTTPYIDFYARITDVETFQRYMARLRKSGFIGSKHRMGFGKILGIDVQQVKDDWSLYRDGLPTRPIPVQDFEGAGDAAKGMSTIYPPYWFTANEELCCLPRQSQYIPREHLDEMEGKLQEMFRQFQLRSERKEVAKRKECVK